MPPEESPQVGAPLPLNNGGGRPPLPRGRISIDGVLPPISRRPAGNQIPGRPQSFGRSTPNGPTYVPQPYGSQRYPTIVRDVAVLPPVAEALQAPVPASVSVPVPEQPLEPQPLAEAAPLSPQAIDIEQPVFIPPPQAQFQPEPEPVLESPQLAKVKRRRPKLQIHIRKRMVLIPLAIILVLGILGGSSYGFLHWRSVQNNPVTIFNDALKAAFNTTQYQAQTDTGGDSKQVNYDLRSLKQPVISVQQTQTVAGQVIQYSGYGTITNSYVSYTKLPATVPASVSSQALNAAVQLRANGKAATGISTALVSLPDPRYQDFGPLLFANIPVKQQQQLINFINSHGIYAYKQTAVRHTTLNDQAVLAYPVTISTSYLKIFNQSVASIEGLAPSDVQAAVSQLSGLTSGTLYVSTKAHKFVEMAYTQNGQSTTISYDYTASNIPDEPQTKLSWASFAPIEFQIEALLSADLSNGDRDAIRQADLNAVHTALASYQATNGYYPTLANMNDQNWVAANLSGLDPETFRDPQATNLMVLDSPKAGNYAYQVVPDSGHGSCVNAGTDPCTHYMFTATLSTAKPFVVNDP